MRVSARFVIVCMDVSPVAGFKALIARLSGSVARAGWNSRKGAYGWSSNGLDVKTQYLRTIPG
jgi:hypothetical protein